MAGPVRYRFGAFVLSPRGRTLTRDGRPVPLIPKYFDVLHLLIERRADAVAKAEIFAAVWSDVIVTDGALAQAVRTLRRALDDDSREPRYIRTVSRHGYQFVAAGVVEEPDTGGAAAVVTAPPGTLDTPSDAVAIEVERLIASAAAGAGTDARDAAARLHAIGTGMAVAALRARPGHARALAYLRDARWDEPTATEVPVASDPERARTAFEVVRLRLNDGAPLVASRSRAGALVGAAVGAVAGFCGGVALALAPGSSATTAAPLALALLGAAAGGVGVSALAAGVAAAELVARSQRGVAVIVAGSAASVLAGVAAHLVVRTLLEGLFAIVYVTIPGPVEGLVLGAAVSLAYVAATWTTVGGGLPAPTGGRRLAVAAATASGGAVAGVLLGALGWPLVGGLIHQIARLSGDAPLALAPLARLIGEPAFGPLTQRLLAAFEGAMFGLAAGLALTRRGR
jgi:DNA-binding winged helix-turn-helix (wHTH) protein